jgi:hypothetical protein
MLDRRNLLALSACLTGLVLADLVFAGEGAAQEPIKIGEINSYSRFPAFTLSYQKG